MVLFFDRAEFGDLSSVRKLKRKESDHFAPVHVFIESCIPRKPVKRFEEYNVSIPISSLTLVVGRRSDVVNHEVDLRRVSIFIVVRIDQAFIESSNPGNIHPSHIFPQRLIQ
jgi:hypothetical protein